jgi:hypothetical protein
MNASLKNILLVILAVIVAMGLTGYGVHKYYKSAEQALINTYSTEIQANKLIQAEYIKQNEIFKKQIDKNNVTISQQSAEIAKLRGQYLVAKTELVAAKSAIKDYTAGESIKLMVDYAQLTDSKMLVQDVDTAVIVTIPSVKKIDNIFIEHKFQKVEIVNLNNTLTVQSDLLTTTMSSLSLYKGLVLNKDLEIATLNENANFNTKRNELMINRLKAQRNRARWTVAGIGAAVIIPTVVNLLK